MVQRRGGGIARIEGKMVWSTKSYERYRVRLCSRMGPGARRLREIRVSGGITKKGAEGSEAGAAKVSALLSKIRAFSEAG